MEVGLAKLEEASFSVEVLKKDLAVMEQELAEASRKAETVGELIFIRKLIIDGALLMENRNFRS